jgi:hypothetical protein
MNHFEYLRETSDDILTNDDKQRAYKGRGGINEHCYPFDLRDETWEALVKSLASSSEGSNQASSLLPTKKSTSKEIAKETPIASITKSAISTVQACAWHQANIKKDFVCSMKGTNPSQCRYLDGSCSLLVHCECAIKCCTAVDIAYRLEDGKSAKCPNHHKSFKKKKNPFKRLIIILGTVMRLIKEMTIMRGVVRRVVVMKDKKMMCQKTKKDQTLMEMIKNQGKMVEQRYLIKLNPVAI